MISIFIVISSPTWFGAWVGLEVNLMSFIPVILDRRNLIRVESCIKYFLVQAFSSLIFLISLLVSIGGLKVFWVGRIYINISLLIALFIKLGAAPFHYWFPSVSGGIGWFQNFILMTLQKLPLLVLSGYLIRFDWIVILVVLLRTMVGGIGGFNQSSLRKLIAFSSINHLGWLLVSRFMGCKYIIIYFFIYSITNGILVFTFSYIGVYYISQLFYYTPNNLMLIIICTN
jgi:NADH-ubiquinone oxidoreductase chain 2